MKLSRQVPDVQSHTMLNFSKCHLQTGSRNYIQSNTKQNRTLSQLIDCYPYYDAILNCNQKTSLSLIQSQQCQISNVFHYPRQETKTKIQIFVGSGFKGMLKECFQSYTSGGKHEYIFISFENQSKSKIDSKIVQQEKNDHLKIFKKSVQSIKYNYKIEKDKRKNEFQEQERLQTSQRQQIERIGLNKKLIESIKSQQVLPKQQHQYKQKVKEVKAQEDLISNSLRNITNTYIKDRPARISHNQQNYQKQDNFHEPSPYQLIQGNQIKHVKENNLQNEEKQHVEKQDSIKIQELECPQQMNQQQIQIEQKTVSNDFNQIEDIQRVQLHHLAEQRENQMNSSVEITEKVIQPNHSEYFIKYNIKFLQGRTRQRTDVTRVSPLKYRKKEESKNSNDRPGIKQL